MIGSTRQISVFACGTPTDMRKSFDSLHALVSLQLKRDALSGDMFLFVSKNRRRAKVLFWDGTGLCIFAKRLENQLFAAPWKRLGPDGVMRMTTSELALFLEGSELVGRVALSPAPFTLAAQAKASPASG
ncbi:MAG: IS66 family insertion sequence element accessory protein TnpB [Myxococcales bacterium]